MENVLQTLLDRGLLESLSSDDHFANLQQAAGDLSKTLLDEPGYIIPLTILALDPEASEEEPVLEKTEEAIKKHWNTFRNRFREGATSVLRAVALDALARASREDGKSAAAIWYAGGSHLRFADLDGSEDVYQKLLASLGTQVESQALDLWKVPSEYDIDTISNVKIDTSGLNHSGVNQPSLQKGLQAAAVPQDTSGQNLGGNAKWPYQGNQTNGRQWGKQFSVHAAKAIAESVGGADENTIEQLSKKLEEALRSHSHSIRNAIRNAINEMFERLRTHQRRSDLMWWMRTRYSPTLRRSYRGLPSSQLAFLMAFDLYRQVPELAPESVEHLLREYAREMQGEPERLTLAKLSEGLASEEAPGPLADSVSDAIPSRKGRTSLADFCGGVIAGEQEPESLPERVGLPGDTEVTPEEVTVWLFRDLQAERLAAS